MLRKLLIVILLFAPFQADAQTQANTINSTLFTALGSRANIERITDDLLTIALTDERISHFFKDTNIKRLKNLLVEQFCELSDGPCHYSGDDMKVVHQGMHLNNAQFNALVEDLQLALTQNKVPYATQNKLLAKLAPMQKEIVNK